MKRVVLLSILFISVHAFSQTTVTTYHDYFKTQKYEVYTAQPNTNFKIGAYKRYDQKGTLIEEATYSNNRLNGVRKVYYDSGTANAHPRPTDYYGKLFAVENYKAGVLQGAAKDYQYVNGRQVTLREFLYRDGQQVNIKEYYRGKEIVASVDLENGECYRNYENGKRKSAFKRVNGIAQGKYVEYHENGKISVEGEYTDGEKTGTWKKFHENGALAEESQEVRIGACPTKLKKQYTDNSVLIAEVFKVNDDEFQENLFSEENGKPISETIYAAKSSNCKLKSGVEKKYYNGVLISSTTFTDGKENGPFTKHFESGKLYAEGNIDYGKYSGLIKIYAEDGRLDMTREYKPRSDNYLRKEFFPNGNLKSEGYFSSKYTKEEQMSDCTYYNEDGSLSHVTDERGTTKTAKEIEDEGLRKKKSGNLWQAEQDYKTLKTQYGANCVGSGCYVTKKEVLFTACREIKEAYIKDIESSTDLKGSCDKSEALLKILEKGIALADVETKDIEKRLRKAKTLDDKIAILSE